MLTCAGGPIPLTPVYWGMNPNQPCEQCQFEQAYALPRSVRRLTRPNTIWVRACSLKLVGIRLPHGVKCDYSGRQAECPDLSPSDPVAD